MRRRAAQGGLALRRLSRRGGQRGTAGAAAALAEGELDGARGLVDQHAEAVGVAAACRGAASASGVVAP